MQPIAKNHSSEYLNKSFSFNMIIFLDTSNGLSKWAPYYHQCSIREKNLKSSCCKFNTKNWPIDNSNLNRLAIISKFVLNENQPILLVTHEDDGSWQILCGTTNKSEDCLVVCFHCIIQRYTFLKKLAWLPKNYLAWRYSEKDNWNIEPKISEIEWDTSLFKEGNIIMQSAV